MTHEEQKELIKQMTMIFDNCLVCKKPIKEIGEREFGMCIDCNHKTDEVTEIQIKEDLIKAQKKGV